MEGPRLSTQFIMFKDPSPTCGGGGLQVVKQGSRCLSVSSISPFLSISAYHCPIKIIKQLYIQMGGKWEDPPRHPGRRRVLRPLPGDLRCPSLGIPWSRGRGKPGPGV